MYNNNNNNRRIYDASIFRDEINRLMNRHYCPDCFGFRFHTVIWTASQIPSKYINNIHKCEDCDSISEPVNKESIRELKINKLLKR